MIRTTDVGSRGSEPVVASVGALLLRATDAWVVFASVGVLDRDAFGTLLRGARPALEVAVRPADVGSRRHRARVTREAALVAKGTLARAILAVHAV